MRSNWCTAALFQKYTQTRLITCHRSGQQILYSFPFHSAGPFGNDVDGAWMTGDNFLRVLALEGLGWKDIHATNTAVADPLTFLGDRVWLRRCLFRKIEVKWHALMA
jgi:hypothetical protein